MRKIILSVLYFIGVVLIPIWTICFLIGRLSYWIEKFYDYLARYENTKSSNPR